MSAIEVWPVIHVGNPRIDMQNVEIARRFPVAGLMLISMKGNIEDVDSCANEIARRYPEQKIGVNYLGEQPEDALNRAYIQNYEAFWTDVQPFVGGRPFKDQLYFKAVAFKGQPHDPDPGHSARIALRLGMIPTTSGSATGVAPEVEKLQMLRNAIGGGAPLALASGATPLNIERFKPYLTHVLVSTGISKPGTDEFDEAKIAAFMRAAA